jgi:catechol 2,3-dioxygenase-like lactoylglutathione lyase family enzyme
VDIQRVDFASVPTRDPQRSFSWYRDVLGLPPDRRGNSEVEAPNVTFAFWNPEADGEEFVPNVAGFALRVADVSAARAELEARGVRFNGETVDTGVCHMAFFSDPDGNTLILHRRYAD